MGFNAIRPAPNVLPRPRRAPPKAAPTPTPTPTAGGGVALAAAESHDFPDSYQRDSANDAPSAAPLLSPRLERLVELAGSRMGCPPEEILSLKMAAIAEPAMVAEFCQHVFDTRERPLREAANPLEAHRAAGRCAFWMEGFGGKAIAVAASAAALPYEGQRLELYAVEHTPFAKVYDPATFAARPAIPPQGGPGSRLDPNPMLPQAPPFTGSIGHDPLEPLGPASPLLGPNPTASDEPQAPAEFDPDWNV